MSTQQSQSRRLPQDALNLPLPPDERPESNPIVLQNLGDIGGAVTFIRRSMGISQAQLAENAGLVRSAISMIESGKRTPVLGTLAAIALALGNIPIHAIFMKARALSHPEDKVVEKMADAIISAHVNLQREEQKRTEPESAQQSETVPDFIFN